MHRTISSRLPPRRRSASLSASAAPGVARRVKPLGLTLSLLFIAAATLTPSGSRTPSVGLFCLGCGNLGLPDVVMNVLLFAPLGLVLGRAGLRPLVVLGIGLLLSSGIEAVQVFLPGRSPTLRDILTNAVGCGLGGLTAVRLRTWVAPGRRAVFLLWSAVGGALLALWLTGALLRFDPPAHLYFGQRVPDQGHLERWKGALQEAWVGDIAVRDGPSGASAALRATLTDSAQVRIVGLAGPPTRRLGAIFAVATEETGEVLLIGPHGHDLVVRVRRLAATWRLDSPEFRFRDALRSAAPGAPLVIEFRGTPRGGCATVNSVRHCIDRQSTGSTWMLARSFDGAPRLVQRLLDALTLFLLVFPAGLLLRATPRDQRIAAVALLVVGVPTVSWWAGLAVPSAWDAVGVIAAIGVGIAFHGRLHPNR